MISLLLFMIEVFFPQREKFLRQKSDEILGIQLPVIVSGPITWRVLLDQIIETGEEVADAVV
jgi:hypothetical protein